MIKSLELKFFRQHEDLKVDFTAGLNTLRGPNESGKTTITESLLYALFGATSLVDALSEVVTWGHKEADLRVKAVIAISGVDYTFNRSKNGAECNYAIDGKAVKVTGQGEVTKFAAGLLGADAKTASVLMLSSQAGLRGALDEGAAAVSALMGKLADFDLIDRLLQSASTTLTLGSDVPVRAKLAEAENEVLAATAAQIDPATLGIIDQKITVAVADHGAAKAAADALAEAVSKADSARDAALSNNESYAAGHRRVTELKTAVASTRSRLDAALIEAAKRPAAQDIQALRDELIVAKNHSTILSAYNVFKSIPAYPAVAWDDTKESFDAEVARLTTIRAAATQRNREIDSEIVALRRQIISGDGKCPSCGQMALNHDHVVKRNAEIQATINALAPERVVHATEIVDANLDLDTLATVSKAAAQREPFREKLFGHLTVDSSVYPVKLAWLGDVPADDGGNVAGVKSRLDTIEGRERVAVQSAGQADAYRLTMMEQVVTLATAEAVAAKLTLVATQPLAEAYDAAYTAYVTQNAKVSALAQSIQDLKNERADAARILSESQGRIAAAKTRVVEYTSDIKALEFNNELVRKLKSMKPLVTDHLWNNVLAAVSNFFSQLRGEQSIVTKDASGFKVNGRGGSLSGSTLDMLALSIRVALSKTFVPASNFLILDEPAHGCDSTRTAGLLGFLSGAGFTQTILASHDELSESVADHVILLGA